LRAYPPSFESLRLAHDKPPEPDALNPPSINPAAEARYVTWPLLRINPLTLIVSVIYSCVGDVTK